MAGVRKIKFKCEGSGDLKEFTYDDCGDFYCSGTDSDTTIERLKTRLFERMRSAGFHIKQGVECKYSNLPFTLICRSDWSVPQNKATLADTQKLGKEEVVEFVIEPTPGVFEYKKPGMSQEMQFQQWLASKQLTQYCGADDYKASRLFLAYRLEEARDLANSSVPTAVPVKR